MNALQKFCIGETPLSYAADICIPETAVRSTLLYVYLSERAAVPLSAYRLHMELPDFSTVTTKGNDVYIIYIGLWIATSCAIVLKCTSKGIEMFWSGCGSQATRNNTPIAIPATEKHYYTLDVANNSYTLRQDGRVIIETPISGSPANFRGALRLWSITQPYRVRNLIHRDTKSGRTAPVYGAFRQGRGPVGLSCINNDKQESIIF